MNMPFQQFLMSDQATHLTGGQVQFNYGPKLPDSPSKTEDGTLIAYLNVAGMTDHYKVMGQFVADWGRVELAMSFLFSAMTRIDFSATRLFLSNQSNRGLQRVLEAFSEGFLEGERNVTINAILERFKGYNTKRNHIIHGQWVLDVRLYDWNGDLGCKVRPVVWYDDGSPQTRRKIKEGHKQTQKNYVFDMPRIQQISKALFDFEKEIIRLVAEIEGRDPDQPVPKAIGL